MLSSDNIQNTYVEAVDNYNRLADFMKSFSSRCQDLDTTSSPHQGVTDSLKQEKARINQIRKTLLFSFTHLSDT